MKKIFKSESTGFGTLGTVQVILIILKLFNLITLPWWQVFIPTYISFVIFLVIIIFSFVVYRIFKNKY